jgi:hypothetical protein
VANIRHNGISIYIVLVINCVITVN